MRLTRRAAVFGLFTIAYFLSYFFRSANAVIAGDLTRELDLTAAQLGLMTSLFYVSFAAVQLPLGVGLDLRGPRRVTSGLMLASVAGALIFAWAESFGVLALGRALIGLGMAGVLMGAFKAFAYWYPPERVATVSSLLVGLGASGGLLAAAPLAWLNAAFGWRAIFGWGALVILASALAIRVWTRDAPPQAAQPAPAPAGGLAQVFRDRRFWRIGPMNFFLIGTALAIQTLWGGPYLSDVAGLSKLAVGNVLLALGGGVVAGYALCGWLADRFGAFKVNVAATAVFTLSQVPFVVPGWVPPLPLVVLAYFALGFTSSFNLILLAQIRALFPRSMSGRAVTAVNMCGFVGVSLIQWAMGLVIGAFARGADGRYPPEAYATAFLFALLGSALAFLWYLPLGRAPRQTLAPVAIAEE
jgi:predicted MFS family arabinose efflux permease